MSTEKSNVKTVCDTIMFGGYLLFLYKLVRRII
jgi:hypothetical protein